MPSLQTPRAAPGGRASAGESAEWYYVAEDKSRVGPHDLQGLLALHTGGVINERTMVWAKPMAKWVKMVLCKELRDARRELYAVECDMKASQQSWGFDGALEEEKRITEERRRQRAEEQKRLAAARAGQRGQGLEFNTSPLERPSSESPSTAFHLRFGEGV